MLSSIDPLTLIDSNVTNLLLVSLIEWQYIFRNIYDLKLFTTFYHHATSIRLHIRRNQIKMPNKVPFVCLIEVETETKLTDLSYTCVMVLFITVFIRNYIFIKYPSTLLFLELQSWHNLINIFSKQESNTSILEKNFAHKKRTCDVR